MHTYERNNIIKLFAFGNTVCLFGLHRNMKEIAAKIRYVYKMYTDLPETIFNCETKTKTKFKKINARKEANLKTFIIVKNHNCKIFFCWRNLLEIK